ncbi:hypothetical protein [Bacillus pseudomycoides]|uniref:hypothetical protein n=1 Tax=Bacillus pseudomycoides TaxID=64104 RepID=UPI0020D26C91|nr:hypothetical protein [Bacillus pseudomycoides]
MDETATNKKQVEKLQKGIEKFEADMSKAGEQLAEVQAKLQEIAQEERQALLLDLAKQDAESKEQSLRENRLRNHLDILRDSLSSGGVGRSLLERELGITHTGNPNVDVTWHDFPVELAMQREAQAEVQDRVDTEFEQLVQAINKYLGC